MSVFARVVRHFVVEAWSLCSSGWPETCRDPLLPLSARIRGMHHMFLFSFVFWDNVSLCSSGWPQIHGNLPALASSLPRKDYRCDPLCPASFDFSYLYNVSVDTYMEVRRQLSGVGLFVLCGFQGLNSKLSDFYYKHLAWWACVSSMFQLLIS